MNVLALVTDRQYLRLIARAFALFTDEFDIGEELHFDGHGTIPLAGFTAPARYVEREMSSAESALLRFGQGSEEFADCVKRLDVGDRIRTRRAPDRRLVDEYDLV